MHNFYSSIFLVIMFFFATHGALQSLEEVHEIEMKPYKGGQFVGADYDRLEKGENTQIIENLLSQECLKREEQLEQLSDPTKKWDDVSEDVWILVARRLPKVDLYSLRLTNLFFSQVGGAVLFGEEIDLHPEAGYGLTLKRYLAAIYQLSSKLDTLKKEMRLPYHRAICERLITLTELRFGLRWADRQDFYSLAAKYHIPMEEDTWAKKLRAYQFWYFYSDCCFLRSFFHFSALFCVAGSVIGEWLLMPARVPDYCKSLYFIPAFSERNTMGTSSGFLDKAILTGITMVPILASTIYYMVSRELLLRLPVACFLPEFPKTTVAQGLAFAEGRLQRTKARSKTRVLITLGILTGVSIVYSLYSKMLLTSQYGPFSHSSSYGINAYNQMMANATFASDPSCCQYTRMSLVPCGPVPTSDYDPDHYDINQWNVLGAQAEFTSHLQTPLILAFWPSIIAFLEFVLIFFKLI